MRAGRTVAVVLATLISGATGVPVSAQDGPVHAEGYLEPSDAVAEAVVAPWHENVALTDLGPDGVHFLHRQGVGLPALEDLARPHRNLAGLYVDTTADRHRDLTVRGHENLVLVDARDGSETEMELPEGARASGVSWSPDGDRLAFLASYEEDTHVYVADVATGRSERISPRPVLATRVRELHWSGDGGAVFTVLLPEDRGAEPSPDPVPETPMVRITTEEENRLRTFPTLFETPYDERLFEHYAIGQVVRLEVEGSSVEPIGDPALVEGLSVSPNGDHLRVETTTRPFSYIVPVSWFGEREAVWDLAGEELALLREEEVRKGVDDEDEDPEEPEKRDIQWRPDGEGLSFLQKEHREEQGEDGEGPGGPRSQGQGDEEPRVDRVMQWLPPFGADDLQVIHESENEMSRVRYDASGQAIFVTEEDGDEEHLYAVFLDEPEERHTIYRHDPDEWRDAPGDLELRSGPRGGEAVRISSDGAFVYLRGTRYHDDPYEDAPTPFLDRVKIRSGESERLFESSSEAYERVDAMLDDDGAEVVIRRESPADVPDSYRRNLGTGDEVRLTANEDHTSDITGARREAFDVHRNDGFTFRVEVVLPPDWDGEPLPAIFWHYPREYEDQDAYDDFADRFNRNRFPQPGPRSAEIFVREGYAVVNPQFPIVGDPDRVNDNFVTDLRANWAAIIDAVDRRGYVDRSRIALGGHSYGGFGTIHALIQTPFFRAGIAGAPNSNRILTPLGFQRERRLLWDKRETYVEMSPIMWSERMEGALLVYHGADDQNVGTWPANSWRLFHALNGLGKTGAFYMYPYEGHGPGAEETLLDMWARWIEWMDHYVRRADLSEPAAPVAADAADEEPEEGGGPERDRW